MSMTERLEEQLPGTLVHSRYHFYQVSPWTVNSAWVSCSQTIDDNFHVFVSPELVVHKEWKLSQFHINEGTKIFIDEFDRGFSVSLSFLSPMGVHCPPYESWQWFIFVITCERVSEAAFWKFTFN